MGQGVEFKLRRLVTSIVLCKTYCGSASTSSHKAEKCRLTSIIESAYGSEQELSDLILFPFGCFQK